MDDEPPPDGPTGALAEEAAAIRRMVEQGAGSPEEIRALAARLREHRQREEMLWRSDVRPVLKKQGKGRFRGHGGPSSGLDPDLGAERSLSSQSAWVGLGLLGLVLVVVVAANTSVWVLLLPVLALLGWAWNQGRADRPR
jgi:hypothetical protein